MSTTTRHYVNRIALVAATGLIVFAVVRFAAQGDFLPRAYSAPATRTDREEGDHSKFEALLRDVMTGPVDIYFDAVQIDEQKPTFSGVQFVDLVDMTGKHLLRFKDGQNQRWLVDPDTVLTFRISPAEGK